MSAREPGAQTVPVAAGRTGATKAELLTRCTFPVPGAQVVCAVSGGADSLALLVLAVAAGCEATAIHVDHGLRAESAGEADVVRDAARRLGCSFEARRVTLSSGPNLEARARAARATVLPSGVLTGHTADDQAETVLLNLMRGAGLDGLCGMSSLPPALSGRSGRRRHPLLRVRRWETRELCRLEGLVPVDDPSNLDPVHRRNRVRHELLPLLDAIAERDVAALVARQADLLRDDAQLLDELAAAIDPCDAAAVAAAPLPLARRAVRRLIAGDGGYPPPAGAVERVLAVARGKARAAELGDGVRVSRSRGRIRVESVYGRGRGT